MFHYPMLPAPGPWPDPPAGWSWQPKYDGWHLLYSGGRYYTRHGTDLTDWPGLQPLQAILRRWSGPPLVGELCAVQRRHLPALRRRILPVYFLVFDMADPAASWADRWQALQAWSGWTDPVRLMPTYPLGYPIRRDPAWVWPHLVEGVVFKHWESRYWLGMVASVLRGEDWRKWKPFPT
jgi:ATP-dependent DNA ligase